MKQEVFYVNITIRESDGIPVNIRPDCWEYEKNFRFHLSIGGRLTDRLKKSVVETRELAEEMLQHYLPLIEKRKYGEFTAEVKSGSGKWESVWAAKNSDQLREKLAALSCSSSDLNWQN